jgi:NADPH:quinone reductase-like Zn-dependent oxidoreductase
LQLQRTATPEVPVKAFALTAENQPASLIDLPDPELAADAALIRIHAASVNGFDVYQAGGGLMAMMPHELPTVIGRDLSGVVEAVGSARTDVAVGDEVLGFVQSAPPLHLGTWAEAVAGGEKLILALKPAGLDWVTAAAIPLAAATALDAVDAVDPQPGDTVLVMGATGGVGAFAIQLAVQRGARVIATAKPGEDDAFVRSLGATDTIDYTLSGLGNTVRQLVPEGLAGLIDGVSRAEAFMPLAALVRDGGRAATTLGAADVDALAARGVRATNIMGTPTHEKLESLAGQAAAGRLQVPVQATFALADASKVLEAFGAGTRGKLVLTVR